MNYAFCLIDTPDRPSLENYVTVCRAQVQAYIKHGGLFTADTQPSNLAGTQVVLFTEGSFPMIVQNATGYAEKAEAEINTLFDTAEWTDPNDLL